MDIQSYIVAAIAIEGIISWAKTIITEKKIQWQVIASLAGSILLVLDLRLNIFSVIGLSEECPIIGQIITAIAISRGTNYFYEFYDRLTNWKRSEVISNESGSGI